MNLCFKILWLKVLVLRPYIVVHASNSSTWEADELKASLQYRETLSQKQTNQVLGLQPTYPSLFF